MSALYARWCVLVVLVVGLSLVVVSCGPESQPVSWEEESGVASPSDPQTEGDPAGPGGYTSRVSYLPGERIDFHISNGYSGSYVLTIYREGDPRQMMGTVPNVQTQNRGCNGGYDDGCGWPVEASFTIPNNWPSGVYMAEFPRTGGQTGKIIFWIREPNPGQRSPILFLSSVNTYQAYNDYGGGSLYGFGTTVKSQWVSFDRPYSGGDGKYPRWEKYFVDWADQAGYEMEFASTYDLEYHADLLSHYDVVIIAGHSEYWTWPMRRQVEAFIESGGRFMNLSGNTMWWQVRFEDGGRTMMGYKNWRKDPLKAPELSTDENWKYPINDGSFPLIGLHWPFGGYPREKGYAIVNAGHWIFNGTGLAENQMIGVGPTDDLSIQDKETDGLAFNCGVDGRTLLGPTGDNMAPDNFTILGITPVYSKQRRLDGFGAMGIYTTANGGAVFSAGTTGWPIGLQYPEIDKITRNVLDRFLAGNVPHEPPGPDAGHLFYDRFNCDNVSQGRFNNSSWENDMTRLNYYESAIGTTINRFTDACGVSGTGLELKVGQSGIYYASQLGRNFDRLNQFQTEVHLDVSNLNLSNDATLDLFQQFVDEGQKSPEPIAALQIGRRNGHIVARYQPDGANLEWRSVPENQMFLLRTVWDASNQRVGLWVDGDGGYTAVDSTMASPNRSDYGRMKASGTVGGVICMDNLAYDDLGGGPPPPQPTATSTPSGPTATPTATPPGPTPTATARPPGPTPTATPVPTATPPSNGNSLSFHASLRGSATLSGISFGSKDVVTHDGGTNTWAALVTGDQHGISKNIRAIDVLDDGSILMAFSANQTIDGLGTVTPNDIVRYVPQGLGQSPAGVFEWYFDGSDVDLSSRAESIDALAVLSNGDLLISTIGTAKLTGTAGQLVARDEDIVRFRPSQLGEHTAGQWSLFLDGSTISGLDREDIYGLSVDEATGDLYIVILGGFNIDGIKGNGRDIVRLVPSGDTYVPIELEWDGSEEGLSTSLDALHVMP